VADATEFTIGPRASCSDGSCGEVTRLVIDPADGTVTHLVITPEHRREAGRLVPVDLVDAVDGEIGRIHGFLVDPGDHRVTHVLLQKGHLWGRKEVAIPIRTVTGFVGGIRLNITKKQVAELPPVG
jgi:PRC-barrel domain protein